MTPPVRKVFRYFEIVGLFFVFPILSHYKKLSIPSIYLLFMIAAMASIYLLIDTSFEKRSFWKFFPLPSKSTLILKSALFLVYVVVSSALIFRFQPERFFYLPKTLPHLWLIILVAYPVFSVYPQELVYRAFIFHRYSDLIPNQFLMMIVSAAAFAWGHLVFDNWIAVGISFAGGLLFAETWRRTHSLFWVSIEHFLYGLFTLSVGLGKFFINFSNNPDIIQTFQF
jgi:membrane protease YdiL (CAAX protease family)